MAVTILVIAFVIEAAFAAYCIITRSNQSKIRSFVRIGALAAFVLSTLLTVIEWGLRWYGLAALLLVWAALGAWTLTGRRAEKKEVQTRRIVLKAAGMLLLAAIALIPALVFPEYKMIETTGEHPVATAIYTYTDDNRVETYTDTGEKRKLTVEFWYPEDIEHPQDQENPQVPGSTYPLVVFSHGSFGVRASNASLYNELASHGYVVVSIDHTYHAFVTTDVDGNETRIDPGYMQEVAAQDAHTKKQESCEAFHKWMALRTGDINFVIDRILAEAGKTDADTVYTLVDPAKIGVMGHSLGGSAALGIGRMRKDVSAVIALESPFMDDIVGVEDGEFVFVDEDYPLPVLNVYSDATWSHLTEWTQYAENAALLSDPGAKAFNVYIRGVGHMALTDFALTSPFFTRVLDGQESAAATQRSLKTINKVSLEFFDCYLKEKCEFKLAGTY